MGEGRRAGLLTITNLSPQEVRDCGIHRLGLRLCFIPSADVHKRKGEWSCQSYKNNQESAVTY